MARKEDNLVKGDEAHKFTPEEASKGGKASAEARRKKRDLKRAIEALLEQDITGKDGTSKSGAEAIAVAQFKKALKGDSKAFEIIRDTSGQSVVQKIAVAEVDADVLSEVERMVMDESE
jgi:hypothetical protein